MKKAAGTDSDLGDGKLKTSHRASHRRTRFLPTLTTVKILPKSENQLAKCM